MTSSRFNGENPLINEIFQKAFPNLEKWIQSGDCFSDNIIETSATVFSFKEMDFERDSDDLDKKTEVLSERLKKTKIKRLEICVHPKRQFDFANLVLKCDQLNEIEYYEPKYLPFRIEGLLIEYYFFSKEPSKIFTDEKLEKALVSK